MIILALLLAPGAFAGDTLFSTKTFAAKNVSRIIARTEAGDVKVKIRAGKDVTAEAHKPTDSEGHCDLSFHLETGTLTLEARKPADSDAVCDGGFVVYAPAGVDLEAYTGSGNVELGALKKTIKARTGSGAIRIVGALGQAYAMTGSGAIRAELPSAAFDARSGSGDIKVKLATASGLVSARTGSGSVEVSLPAGAKVRLTTASASGKVTSAFRNEPKAPLVIEAFSGSGDVTVSASK
jgi:DUF4097 and DUF4098 domain-containing protein YvlB